MLSALVFGDAYQPLIIRVQLVADMAAEKVAEVVVMVGGVAAEHNVPALFDEGRKKEGTLVKAG